MSCRATRERLLELDVGDFHQVEHLAVCASCRAFAEATEAAEQQLAAHVDAFVDRVPFEQAIALIDTPPTTRSKNVNWIYTGLIAAAAAAVLVFTALSSTTALDLSPVVEPAVSAPEDTVMVIVSARDLPAGYVITDEDIYAVEIVLARVPRASEVYLSPAYVTGQEVVHPILANEFIRCRRLARPCPALPDEERSAPVSRHRLDAMPDGQTHLLLARHDLPAGHVLTEQDLFPFDITEDFVPRQAFDGDPGKLVGVEVATPIFAQEAIRCERLRVGCPDDSADRPMTGAVPIGQSILLELPGHVLAAQSSEPEVAAVEILAESMAVLHGQRLGETTIAFTLSDHDDPLVFELSVQRAERPFEADSDADAIILRQGEEQSLAAPWLTDWTVGDPSIAEVEHSEDGTQILGLSPGVTTVILLPENPNDRPIVRVVSVHD